MLVAGAAGAAFQAHLPVVVVLQPALVVQDRKVVTVRPGQATGHAVVEAVVRRAAVCDIPAVQVGVLEPLAVGRNSPRHRDGLVEHGLA